jgi:hypothetical protein
MKKQTKNKVSTFIMSKEEHDFFWEIGKKLGFKSFSAFLRAAINLELERLLNDKEISTEYYQHLREKV